MRASAVIDTGAILALLDRNDQWHEPCKNAFRQMRLPLLTSQAVLTELFHLVGDSRAEMDSTWKFIRSGALILGTIEDAELPQLRKSMSRYWDQPNGFCRRDVSAFVELRVTQRNSHSRPRRFCQF